MPMRAVTRPAVARGTTLSHAFNDDDEEQLRYALVRRGSTFEPKHYPKEAFSNQKRTKIKRNLMNPTGVGYRR